MRCQVKGVDVYYEQAGSGKPLFMLHGGGLDHRHMQQDMESVFTSRKGWKRIYPDLPGSGQTKAQDWITNPDDCLEVVLGFIDKVASGEDFAVAGMSYGGYLARGVVKMRMGHVNGLLLVVPTIEPDQGKRNPPQHRVVKEDTTFLSSLKPDEAWMREFAVVQSVGFLEYQRQWIIPAIAGADREFQQKLEDNKAFSFDVDLLPEPFPAPTLILAGKFDPWCGYREAYQILDNYTRATFAILDRAGHALSYEQNGLFIALVREWLDRVEEYIGLKSLGK